MNDMKPIPRNQIIQTHAARLLEFLRDNTVNDLIIYAKWEGIPDEVDIMTDEFNNSRLWDTCEIPLSKVMQRLSIPRKVIQECITLLEQQGLVKMMSDWWKVYLNTE